MFAWGDGAALSEMINWTLPGWYSAWSLWIPTGMRARKATILFNFSVEPSMAGINVLMEKTFELNLALDIFLVHHHEKAFAEFYGQLLWSLILESLWFITQTIETLRNTFCKHSKLIMWELFPSIESTWSKFIERVYFEESGANCDGAVRVVSVRQRVAGLGCVLLRAPARQIDLPAHGCDMTALAQDDHFDRKTLLCDFVRTRDLFHCSDIEYLFLPFCSITDWKKKNSTVII